MAVSFLVQPDRQPRHGGHPATRRPQLVAIDGGRSSAAIRRRRVYFVRRLFVGLVALLVVIVGVVATSAVSAAVSSDTVASDTVVPASYEVAPGDTLWSIAGELGVDADRREVVQLLAVANGGTVVVPGQHLQIPDSVRALGA